VRYSPPSRQQIDILAQLASGDVLCGSRRRPRAWYWRSGAAAEGAAISGLVHRGTPLIEVSGVGSGVLTQALLTDAGRAALAAAKEGTP
jgi:hypothetical protein